MCWENFTTAYLLHKSIKKGSDKSLPVKKKLLSNGNITARWIVRRIIKYLHKNIRSTMGLFDWFKKKQPSQNMEAAE
jgi:hypothetical protein